MKKILFLHSTLGVAGAEMMRMILLRNIGKDKYDIRLCCIGEKGRIGLEIGRLGYKVEELKQNPNSFNMGITYKLIKYIRKEKPDILHTSLFYANFHGRLAGLLCRVPHIITEEHGEHKLYKGIKFFPYILADFLLSRVTDFIICCSEKLRDDIIKKERLPYNKVASIENCLDITLYKLNIPRTEIRKKYNIFDEIVFITVANLKAGKGHDYLIETFREIVDAGYSFRCFFAGDGPLKGTLQKRCYELGLLDKIFFLGNIPNITDYLNASDVFILPSFSEGLSVALMEAMYMGIAPIVTNVGTNPDLIKDGFNGIVFLPGDKDGLKNAIIFYLQNKSLIKEFGRRSKSILEAQYSSISKYKSKFYELWDRCCDNKKNFI